MLRTFSFVGEDIDELTPGLIGVIFQEDFLATVEGFRQIGVFSEEVTVGEFLGLLDGYRDARYSVDIKHFRKSRVAEVEAAMETCKRDTINLDPEERQRVREKKLNELNQQSSEEEAMFINHKTSGLHHTLSWDFCKRPDAKAKVGDYTYWLSVYARVVFVHNLFSLTEVDRSVLPYVAEKRDRFLNGQIPLMGYLDNLSIALNRAPKDSDVDVLELLADYRPLGQSNFPDDVDMISFERVVVKNKETPEEILREHIRMPDLMEQAKLVRRRILDDDQSLIKWLVYGTTPRERERFIVRNAIAPPSTQRNKTTRTPVLSTRGRQPLWRLPWVYRKQFTDVGDILDHSIWAGMLVMLSQLSEVRETHEEEECRDAAYLWQLAFLELIDVCDRAGQFSDEFMLKIDKRVRLSVLEVYYPYSERAFHHGDLPNIGNVLATIPLYGEQEIPDFDIGKVINKSMNFACVRRHLSQVTCDAITDSVAAFKVISRVMWCMLTGTYPGSQTRLDGETALRVKRTCDAQGELAKQLLRDKDRSCRVIFTAFRAYIAFYGTKNPLYATASAHYIDWYYFVDDTRTMAEQIRSSNMRANDMFAEARLKLERHNKSNTALVYRYRKGCLSQELYKFVSGALETTMFRELEDAKVDLHYLRLTEEKLVKGEDYGDDWIRLAQRLEPSSGFMNMDARTTTKQQQLDLVRKTARETRELIEEYSRDVPKAVKEKILNTLFCTPEEMRFESCVVNLLTDEAYGGLKHSVVSIMDNLVRLYYGRFAPKDCEEQLASLDAYHLRVLTWYLYCCRAFDRIHLIPLDAVTQEKIELAMKTERVRIFPGIQEINDKDFEVYVTLCCNSVVTEKGTPFGHDDVRYNMHTHEIVCKKKKKTKHGKTVVDNEAAFEKLCFTEAEAKQQATARKNQFLAISCENQPVMRICIRGYALQVGVSRSTKKRYMHCPKCACFHQVKTQCYFGDGGYQCTKCLKADKTIERFWTCAYCDAKLDPRWVPRPKSGSTGPQGDWRPPQRTLEVLRTRESHDTREAFDPMTDPIGATQTLHFCEKHYNHACYITKRLPEHRQAGIKPFVLRKDVLLELLRRRQIRDHFKSDGIVFQNRGYRKK